MTDQMANEFLDKLQAPGFDRKVFDGWTNGLEPVLKTPSLTKTVVFTSSDGAVVIAVNADVSEDYRTKLPVVTGSGPSRRKPLRFSGCRESSTRRSTTTELGWGSIEADPRWKTRACALQ